MASIATRAIRLNLITPYQSKMFWIEMGKLGYRKCEPNEPPKERPKLLKRMIDFHVKRLDYSVAQIAQLLHLHVPSFLQMYGTEFLENTDPGRPSLRIIK